MNVSVNQNSQIIERNVYCPYCENKEAMLISELYDQRTTLQCPAYGKRYLLLFIFTLGLYLFVHGFPIFEKKRSYEYITYGFCPHCGKSFNAGVPNSIKTSSQKSPKVYRSVNDKKLFGICGGIAEYTGLPPIVVRIAMAIYSFSITPAIVYFVVGLFDIMKENPKQLKENSKH